MSRKAIPKSVRFEVFKRDSFTCQYCGSKAPDVILEIDHIQPVSKGGDNNVLNLVTCCKPCNSGKSNKVLSEQVMLDKQRAQLEELQERRAQLELMHEWRKELLDLEHEEIDIIDYMVSKTYNVSLSAAGRAIASKNIKRFGLDHCLSCMEIACKTYSDVEVAIHKWGGICYNTSKNGIVNGIAKSILIRNIGDDYHQGDYKAVRDWVTFFLDNGLDEEMIMDVFKGDNNLVVNQNILKLREEILCQKDS